MTEIRIVKNRAVWRQHGWSSVPNALLLRSDISWDAKGAFGWLSLAADDPEFDVDANSLASAGPRGRDHAQKMLRELEEHGFLTRKREPGENGVPEIVYELSPVALPSEKRTYKPSIAKRRKRAFSQVSHENLDGQVLDADQPDVDNSPSGPDDGDTPPSTGDDVSAGQARKPDRPGPGRSGPDRSGGLTTSSERVLPPPSSSSAEVVDGVDEEEASDEEQETTARQLVAGLRFRADRFLMPKVKQQVVALVGQRLQDGWPTEFLGRKLAQWAEQASNPSTYLPMQLEQLGTPPRPRLQVVPDEKPAGPAPASEDTRAAVMAQLRAQSRPARPVSQKTAVVDGAEGPQRALGDLNGLLGQLQGQRSS